MDAAITGTVKSVLQDVTRLGYISEKLFWNINFSTQRGDWWSTVFSRQIFSSAIFLLIVPFRRADFSFVNAGYLDINSALFFRMFSSFSFANVCHFRIQRQLFEFYFHASVFFSSVSVCLLTAAWMLSCCCVFCLGTVLPSHTPFLFLISLSFNSLDFILRLNFLHSSKKRQDFWKLFITGSFFFPSLR